jgi:hypothetical protein
VWKRSLLVLCYCPAVLLVGYSALWVTWPVDRVNRETFAKILPG